jgi:hypothetical protein
MEGAATPNYHAHERITGMHPNSSKREEHSMASIAEQVFETVKALPDEQAAEVLNFVEGLKARLEAEQQAQRDRALAVLGKYRGRYKAEKFDREECQQE